MKIELLYPAIASLYGEHGNILMLKEAIPHAHFYETHLDEVPAFARTSVNLIYMGPTNERYQLKIIERLMPYKEKIKALIDEGTYFLITGNALDIFGQYIIDEQGVEHPALGLFDFYTKEDRMHRHNSFVLGQYKRMDMVGFKSQFSFLYPLKSLPAWISVERGTGFHPQSKQEGIHKQHFFGTQCLGPILVLNPFFTLDLLKGLGVSTPKLPYQEVLISAYHQRVSEFRDPDIINYP